MQRGVELFSPQGLRQMRRKRLGRDRAIDHRGLDRDAACRRDRRPDRPRGPRRRDRAAAPSDRPWPRPGRTRSPSAPSADIDLGEACRARRLGGARADREAPAIASARRARGCAVTARAAFALVISTAANGPANSAAIVSTRSSGATSDLVPARAQGFARCAPHRVRAA